MTQKDNINRFKADETIKVKFNDTEYNVNKSKLLIALRALNPDNSYEPKSNDEIFEQLDFHKLYDETFLTNINKI